MEIAKINAGKLESAIKLIKEGGVAVFPTDTVYGFIADATNKRAVEKIFKIKNRPKSKPLPLFVKDIKMAKELAFVDEKQERFLGKAWPERITVVLELKNKKSLAYRQAGKIKITNKKLKVYGVAKNTIALRVPKYKLLNDLLEKINKPLAQTSANISGRPASGNIKKIIKQFEKQTVKPDLVVDAGNLPKRKPSKIIDLTKIPYKVLRK